MRFVSFVRQGILGVTCLAGLIGSPAFADSASSKPPMIEIGSLIEAHGAKVLFEEGVDGELTGDVLIVGGDKDSEKAKEKLLRLLVGIQVNLSDGMIGVRPTVELAERARVGFELEINPIFARTIRGSFAHLAPIPGEFGKRIYISGKVYRLRQWDTDGNDESPEEEEKDNVDAEQITRALGIGYQSTRDASGSVWFVEIHRGTTEHTRGSRTGDTRNRLLLTVGINGRLF